MASINTLASVFNNASAASKHYSKKADATKAATKLSNEALAQAKKNFTAYSSSGIESLVFFRTGVTGDMGVEIRFTSKIPIGQIKDFTLDIQYQLSTDMRWRQYDNDYKTLSKNSNIGGNPVTYTYNFDAQNDVNVCGMNVKVLPNSLSRDVSYTAYEVKYHKKTKSHAAYYSLSKVTKKVSVAYFTAGWSSTVSIEVPPALQDSNDAEKLLLIKPPARPSNPTARILSNGAIEISFDAVDPEDADTSRDVYRCDDGDYIHPATGSLSGHIEDPNTTRFVDQTVAPGHEYRYYVRAYNNRGTGTYDEEPSLPADLCDPIRTAPVEVEGLTAVGYGATGARVSFAYPNWAYYNALQSVRVYYSNDREELVTNTTTCQSAEVTLGMPVLSVIVTGLTAGETWYFCPWLSTGDDAQQQRFCDSIASCTIAAIPDPPTLLDVQRAAYIGDEVEVSWAHNCEDGSAQEAADIIVTVIGHDETTSSYSYSAGADESCTISIIGDRYPDLSTLLVKVRTKGASDEYSDWSDEASISVYARPVASISVVEGNAGGSQTVSVSKLPLKLSLSVDSTSGQLTQEVIQWTVVIKTLADGTYMDMYGNESFVSSGEVVTQLVIDYYDDIFVQPVQAISIPATEGTFINGMAYSASVSALMDSGLEIVSEPIDFSCDFETGMPSPFAFILPNPDWSVRIYPSLADDGEPPDDPDDVLLSVYRINSDFTLSTICEGFPCSDGVFCTDQHPSFGEMSYRIVANSQETDEVTVCDIMDYNDWDGILIQWAETDVAYDELEGGEIQMAFEFVRLPWNIQISQSSEKDVAYKKYQGRRHPVALYGTQIGESGSWSCEIVKFEEDWELSQLRKLAGWMGSCWVRESSGLSYPANVDVSITRSYDSPALSVSLEVTRVDD